MFVNLQGGLGNQMFQAAFGWSIAAKAKLPVLFVKQALGPGCHRAYGLDAFKGDVQIASKLPQHVLRYQEAGFAFDPNAYRHMTNYMLFSGNWQSEKYFDEVLVRDNFRLAEPLSPASQECVNLLTSGTTCSIHVRRTDYAIPSTARYHGLMGMDYYNAAIQHVKARTSTVRFFIFSDDKDWCRQHFIGPEFAIVNANGVGSGDEGPSTEHEDIFLMSLCNHAIIPNSSFGWWGAWLNPDTSRMVIAPKNWFNPEGPAKNFDTRDICPERWTRL